MARRKALFLFVIERENRDGSITTYEYDALDRLIRTVRPNQTETLVTYDALDQIVKLENLCSACGEDISVYEYTYDEDGNITSETAGESLVGYLYDSRHDGKHEDKHDEFYPHGMAHGGKHEKDGDGQARFIETTRAYTYDDAGRILTCFSYYFLLYNSIILYYTTSNRKKSSSFFWIIYYSSPADRRKYYQSNCKQKVTDKCTCPCYNGRKRRC